MKNESFYNTTSLKGDELKDATAKAENQEDLILRLFKNKDDYTLSPSMIMKLTDNVYPITSVRRAVTNLTNEGVLIKLNTQVSGMYGRAEHLWRWTNIKEGQMQLL